MKWTKECTWRREKVNGVETETDFTLTVTNNAGITVVARYTSVGPDTTIVITHGGLDGPSIETVVDGIAAIVMSIKASTHERPKLDPLEKELHARLDKRIEEKWGKELHSFGRIRNVLRTEKIEFVGQLVQKTEADMMKLWRFGRVSLNTLKKLLSDDGLHFCMKIDGWKPPNER